MSSPFSKRGTRGCALGVSHYSVSLGTLGAAKKVSADYQTLDSRTAESSPRRGMVDQFFGVTAPRQGVQIP